MTDYGVKFKSGVVCQELKESIVKAINKLSEFAKKWEKYVVITSMNDGEHSQNSLHYKNLAVDIRIWNLNKAQQSEICDHFNSDSDYDCVLESNHIHLEYDPK